MPSPRAWNNCIVEIGERRYESVNVTISRAGTAVVASRATRSTLLTRETVSQVRSPARKQMIVEFVDGTQWKVTTGDCGCGGSR